MPKVKRRGFAEVWGGLVKLPTKDLAELKDMIEAELASRKPKEKAARKPRPPDPGKRMEG